MKERRETEPRYVISVAARMLGIQTHTLRYYEKIGIVEPRRSPGNIRLYSEEDLELLRRIRSLVNEMGVNLAGVEVILHMLTQMNEMKQELDQVREELDRKRRVA
jgi:MerR family transcriptional regulator/heat shock protein HspR